MPRAKVGPHQIGRKNCKTCDKPHTVNVHRFHGDGSYCGNHWVAGDKQDKYVKWCEPSHPSVKTEEERARRRNNIDPRTQSYTKREWHQKYKQMKAKDKKKKD